MALKVPHLQNRFKSNRVALLTAKVDSLTFTLAKALTFQGMEVDLLCEPNRQSDFCARIEAIPEARIHLLSERDEFSLEQIGPLIVQAHPILPSPKALNTVRLLVQEPVRLITGGDKGWSWKRAMELQLEELKSLRRAGMQIQRVVYKDGCRKIDLYRFLGIPRFICGFDVHSQFLVDPQLFKAMFHNAWDPQKPRTFRVSFLGCLDPRHRRDFLPALRPLFSKPNMYWHEYTNSDGAGVSAQDCVHLLTDSDFVLCPPGYSLVTHRPLEALLRGAIPILNEAELDLYGIALEDQVNCWAVKHHGWKEAIRHVRDLPWEKVLSMRCRIHEMQDHIQYEKTSLAMCQRLGVL